MSKESVSQAPHRGRKSIANDPDHIAIAKSKGIHIDWKDGVSSDLDLEYLRDCCPCASCTGAHGSPSRQEQKEKEAANPFPMFKPALKIDHVSPVGNYAIKIDWNDGHNTGIYTFEYLRELGDRRAAG